VVERNGIFNFLTGRPDAEDGGCECLPAPGKINMPDILCEGIWLAWKADVICSASCKGLCAGCESNLNISACQCEQSGGNRPFAALRKLRLDA
jgi:uncharacterized protein